MSCPHCSSGNFGLLPLIWEQGTHIGGLSGHQSLEAAKFAPPLKVPVAKRILIVLAVGLLGGPILTTAFGRTASVLITAVLLVAVGLPLLRDLRWNHVEQAHARQVWSRTFSCRSCGHRWMNGQVGAAPQVSPRMRNAAIAALCLVAIGPGLVTRRSVELASSAARPVLETVYLQGPMNVRAGPGTSFPTVATLQRGAALSLGPKDGNGWAVLHTPDGRQVGFVYRDSELMQPYRR